MLANRLKPILTSLISPFQSAFVPGRLISDNSLLAVEVGHFLHNKRSGKEGYFALKLDLSKAYDRVEWSFLETMMPRMGFVEPWISLVMTCVSSVSYSFQINGEPKGYLIPSRGLRQGNPLSPYLFLLCVEGLSGLIAQNEREGSFHEIKIADTTPCLHHLLFTDDSFFFARATVEDCSVIQHVLDIYSQESGQAINFAKSSIAFGMNAALHLQVQLASFLGVQRVKRHERYLGLPTFVGKNKKQTFSFIKEIVTQRLHGWKGKLFSTDSELLIKVVTQALPAYAMQSFLLPRTFC